MDREGYTPQSTGAVREGHDPSDLSVRGLVTSAVVFAACGFLSFALMAGFLAILPKLQTLLFGPPPQLTPVQQQLLEERKTPAKVEAETGRPEWYAPSSSLVRRGEMESHLDKTFPAPRLQYDDVREMQTFLASERNWLGSAGKDEQGNIHISIDSAMDLLAKRGLPPVSGPFVPPTLPAAVPLVPAPAQPGSRK